MISEYKDWSVTEVADRVARGEVSAVEVLETALARIDAIDPHVSAFLAKAADRASADAKRVDALVARGEDPGPLAGVPIALKDALVTRGIATTCGSKILEGYVPPYDATVVSRLRAAGAVFPGKTNMDEFAMGSSNENSAFGAVKNPWDTARIPGGSSGGSAASVSARMTPGALGSDTGGSIRQPAALTGVVGVKPTYGRVSRFGLIAFASSLDQIGPFATDVRGAARLLGAIAGHDPNDATSLDAAVPDYEAACARGVRGLRIGIPDEYFARGLDPEVEACVRAAIEGLRAEGATVKSVTLPHTRYAVATYYVIATAEASSNLSRFDGIRFGLRVPPAPEAADPLRAMIGTTRDQGFGTEVKRRILLGTFVLSAGYYDAYYKKAQQVRTLIRRDFEAAFHDVDVIASPTTPTPAFLLGEKSGDPLAMYLSDAYTLPASLAGIPAASFPCGFSSEGNGTLPIGLQLMAPPLEEARLFAAGAAWESRRPWKHELPPVA